MDLSSLLGGSKGRGEGSKSAPFKKRRVRHPKKIVQGGTSRKGAPPARPRTGRELIRILEVMPQCGVSTSD